MTENTNTNTPKVVKDAKEPVVKFSPAAQEEWGNYVKAHKPAIAQHFVPGSFAKGTVSQTPGCWVKCPECGGLIWRMRGDWHHFSSKSCPVCVGGGPSLGFTKVTALPKNLPAELTRKIQALIDQELGKAEEPKEEPKAE